MCRTACLVRENTTSFQRSVPKAQHVQTWGLLACAPMLAIGTPSFHAIHWKGPPAAVRAARASGVLVPAEVVNLVLVDLPHLARNQSQREKVDALLENHPHQSVLPPV